MAGPVAHLPMVVATIGMQGSASTWVYNVVREIMAACLGSQMLLQVFADDVSHLPDDATIAGRPMIIKSHHGPVSFDDWLVAQHAPVFLSIRDPRDAALSSVYRFRRTLDRAIDSVRRDCERIVRLAGAGHPVLRYEDRFFENPAVVADLAARLGQTLPEAVLAAIFERYRTEAVRAFAARIDRLPAERVRTWRAGPMDRLTQIHATHIGSTASGKWQSLPPPLQVALTETFAPFLDRFGYAAHPNR